MRACDDVGSIIAVVGSGLMGRGIAAVCWFAGHATIVVDSDRSRLTGVREAIMAMGSHRADPQPHVRLETSSDLNALARSDFIFEAIPEDLAAKRALYRNIEDIVRPDAILASTTSSFVPSELAARMANPERFIVAHFWNPAQAIDLVEVVPGKQTSEETYDRTVELLREIGQRPIRIAHEAPGFIGNRLQLALLREALYLLETGVASAADIDDVVRSTLGPRYCRTGPLESADLGGIQTFTAVAKHLFPVLACGLDGLTQLERLVDRGELGAKTGSGFYSWDDEKVARLLRERDAALTWNKGFTLDS